MGCYICINPAGKDADDIDREPDSRRRPEVDLSLCNECGGCIETAPGIFRFNEVFGFVETADLDYYDPELVDEAIKNCPRNAIKRGEE